MTSSRNRMKHDSASRRPICFGCPSSSASTLMPKVVCNWVNRNSWFSTTSGVASRFSSMTMRMPERSLSSRISPMPSISLARTSSAIFSIRVFLFT